MHVSSWFRVTQWFQVTRRAAGRDTQGQTDVQNACCHQHAAEPERTVESARDLLHLCCTAMLDQGRFQVSWGHEVVHTASQLC